MKIPPVGQFDKWDPCELIDSIGLLHKEYDLTMVLGEGMNTNKMVAQSRRR